MRLHAKIRTLSLGFFLAASLGSVIAFRQSPRTNFQRISKRWG
jgi:hypothetical protein